MYYLLMSIYIWLAVGFLYGLKEIYVDRFLDAKNIQSMEEDLKEKFGSNPEAEFAFGLLTHKPTFLIMMTLLGFIPIIKDLSSFFISDEKESE